LSRLVKGNRKPLPDTPENGYNQTMTEAELQTIKGNTMKSKLFSTVLLLAAISAIGIITIICGCRQSKDAKDAELARVLELPYQVQTLVGVEGVWVLIDYLGEAARSTGLTEDQFKKEVEVELLLAGIKVNARQERATFKDGAYLHISINTLAYNDSPDIVYSISIELSQTVELRTSLPISARAITWHDRSVGMYTTSEFAQSTRQEVKEGIHIFIEEYLIANPDK
jgi:hypothetical protein